MAFILDVDAALRLLAGRRDDLLLRWIADEEIVPMVAAETLGSALHLIRTDGRLSIGQREEMRRRWDAMRDELILGNGRSASFAFFDAGCAERLAELLSAEIAPDFGDMDLIPVAIALTNGWTVLAGGDEAPYRMIDTWLQAQDPAGPQSTAGTGGIGTRVVMSAGQQARLAGDRPSGLAYQTFP